MYKLYKFILMQGDKCWCVFDSRNYNVIGSDARRMQVSAMTYYYEHECTSVQNVPPNKNKMQGDIQSTGAQSNKMDFSLLVNGKEKFWFAVGVAKIYKKLRLTQSTRSLMCV